MVATPMIKTKIVNNRIVNASSPLSEEFFGLLVDGKKSSISNIFPKCSFDLSIHSKTYNPTSSLVEAEGSSYESILVMTTTTSSTITKR